MIPSQKISNRSRPDDKETDISGAEDDIQTLTQNTSTALTLLDGKISSKVSQSDFDSEKHLLIPSLEVLQTAESYSIKVGETQAARRNMLVGTAFRRRMSFCIIMRLVIPYVAASCSKKNAGYKGNKCYLYQHDRYGTTLYRFAMGKHYYYNGCYLYVFCTCKVTRYYNIWPSGCKIELRVNPSGVNKDVFYFIVPSKAVFGSKLLGPLRFLQRY